MFELIDAGWMMLDAIDRVSIDDVQLAHRALSELRRGRALITRSR
jgi:hypothetical protein